MKIVSIIFVICLIHNAYLKPASEEDTSIFSCPYITSISTVAYNSNNLNGVKNVKEQNTCSYIGSNKKVAFLVHGFLSSPETFSEMSTKLAVDHYTVFAVDWSEGACSYPPTKTKYRIAVNNTRKVGELIANYIAHITRTCKVPLEKITLIGHSLGAHICGFAAKKVKSSGHGTISLIFGADPAGPSFSDNKCEDRLCDTDAARVNCLHTSTKWGISKSICHLNLYFNDGSSQPGCAPDLLRTCAHSRAIAYLTALLPNSNCGFPGISKLEKFDESLRPTAQSTNCIFVNKKIFDQNTITGAYTVFVNKNSYCSSETFPKCQQ